MNKEFEIINNRVIVTDEKGNKIGRALIPNIREVLICENNIDTLEDLIENEEEQIKESKKIIRNKSSYYFSLASLCFVINSSINSLFSCLTISVSSIHLNLNHFQYGLVKQYPLS